VSTFACNKCGANHGRWIPRCPACQAWSSSTESVTGRPAYDGRGAKARSSKPDDGSDDPAPISAPARAVPVSLTDVDETVESRIQIGIEPLDRVLGGGLVLGSVVLLGGQPGIGKSTLLAQVLATIPYDRILYATGEESVAQVAIRARRLNAMHKRIKVLADDDVDHIIESSVDMQAQVLAVDSVQTLSTGDLPGSVRGSVSQVKECSARLAAFAKRTGVPVLLVCHVTKEGGLAGPKTLDHLVDVILEFEAHEDVEAFRVISAPSKNRYGKTGERGAFEMTDVGLRAIPRDDDRAQDDERKARKARDGELLPVAQELLSRFVEIGGIVDADLRDRIAGRLDATPRGKP